MRWLLAGWPHCEHRIVTELFLGYISGRVNCSPWTHCKPRIGQLATPSYGLWASYPLWSSGVCPYRSKYKYRGHTNKIYTKIQRNSRYLLHIILKTTLHEGHEIYNYIYINMQVSSCTQVCVNRPEGFRKFRNQFSVTTTCHRDVVCDLAIVDCIDVPNPK